MGRGGPFFFSRRWERQKLEGHAGVCTHARAGGPACRLRRRKQAQVERERQAAA